MTVSSTSMKNFEKNSQTKADSLKTSPTHIPTEKSIVGEKPSERCFVTKISKQVTEEELTKYFEQFGKLTDVHMPKTPGQKSGHKGIAFISFVSGEIARGARDMKEHRLSGNQRIVVDHATTRNHKVSAARKAETKRKEQLNRRDGMDEYYAYMTGTTNYDEGSYEGCERNVVAAESSFSTCATTTSNAGQSSNSSSSIDNSINSWENSDLSDWLNACLSNGDWGSSFSGASASNTNSWSGNNSNPSNNNRGSSSTNSSNNNWGQQGSNQQSRGNINRNDHLLYESNRVFVTKVANDCTKENIMDYFKQFGEIEDCYLPASPSPTQPHKGIAFVSFKDARVAQHVLQKKSGKYEIKPGQFIVVDKANMRTKNLPNGQRGSQRSGSNNGGSSYRSSPY